jgi:flagellar motor protein MotB
MMLTTNAGSLNDVCGLNSIRRESNSEASMIVRRKWILGAMLLACAVGAWAQDAEGSKDHPLISRYPGSTISHYSEKAFDEYELPLSKVASGKYAKTQHVEGKVTAIYYTTPEGRSAVEVYRNYESALKNAGFETLFTCARTCGDAPPSGSFPLDDAFGNYAADTRYLAAKLARAAGEVYVALWVYDSTFDIKSFLAVVESKPMETGLVTVDAATLAGDISRTGHASVYGIYFDTGKADVKPESDATLKEVAKLLQQDPKLKLYVVGHTDNQGTLETNMDLSMRRANAVVQALAGKYGVAAARLKALGDGPSAPVASNDNEDGRAKNRRVELVKQ